MTFPCPLSLRDLKARNHSLRSRSSVKYPWVRWGGSMSRAGTAGSAAIKTPAAKPLVKPPAVKPSTVKLPTNTLPVKAQPVKFPSNGLPVSTFPAKALPSTEAQGIENPLTGPPATLVSRSVLSRKAEFTATEEMYNRSIESVELVCPYPFAHYATSPHTDHLGIPRK